jgi:uncharacterized protein YyaL (SSP411 family)
MDFYLSTPKEVVIVSPADGGGDDARALAREVWTRYLPNKVLVQASESDTRAAESIPLLRERTAVGGRATAYVCEHYACRQPVSTPGELASQLSDDSSSAMSAEG